MGLGTLGTCVAEAGVGEGLGVPAAGEAGARYLIMAGSTSGVPWKTKIPLRILGYYCVNIHMCLKCVCVFLSSHPLWCVDGRQRIQVCHWELNAFPLQFLINVDHAS